MSRFFLRAAAALLLLTSIHAHAVIAVPPAAKRVTDLSATLTESETEGLARELERINKTTGATVLILIVSTLDGEDIEGFSVRVFDAWKPGNAGVNDGVVILLSKKERRMRIAVGRGLEGAIPDLAAKRITQGVMVPAFKKGEFARGFMEASLATEKLIVAEKAANAMPAKPSAAVASTPAEPDSEFPMGAALIAGFGIVACLALFLGKMFAKKIDGDIKRAQTDAEAYNQAISPSARPRPTPVRRSLQEVTRSYPRSTAPSRRASSGSVAAASFETASTSRSRESSGDSGSSSSSNNSSSGGGDTAGGGASDSY